MRSIRQIKTLKGKRVILRTDFNVPIAGGVIADEFRILKSLPTIRFLQKKKAKIIIISHLGKGGTSLDLVARAVNKYVPVDFVPQIFGEEVGERVAQMSLGDIILLENLRNDTREQKGDKNFAKELASLGDIYINDAFAVSHRKDASVVLLPKLLPAYAGLQMEEEIKNLTKVIEKPKHPFLVILGGAKFSTKLPLIKKYLKSADNIFVGGALANEFLKAKGLEIGKSLIGEDATGIKTILNSKKILLPGDVLVKSEEQLINKKVENLSDQDFILDIGKESIARLEFLVSEAKFILWNGPLGKYESGAAGSTKIILKSISKTKAHSVVGGGDTASIVSELKISNKISFVSTGGGATLAFLAHGTLPGIKALG